MATATLIQKIKNWDRKQKVIAQLEVQLVVAVGSNQWQRAHHIANRLTRVKKL